MKTGLLLSIIVVSSFFQQCFAYEIETHGLITDHAFRISSLNPQSANSVVPLLGFDRLPDDTPFDLQGGESALYYDERAVIGPAQNIPIIPGQLYRRNVQNQERRVFDALVSRGYVPGQSGESIEQRVRAWLMRGAIREDDNDYKVAGYYTNGDQRDDDPYTPLFRAFRHFYDPVHNRASEHESLCAEYGCVESILWALGRTAPLSAGSDADDTSRRNHFTWQDARNNYWWALTLNRPTASLGSIERLNRWATAIKSLGHVIHLLQDTAQPQHVRNDLHGPPLTALVTGDGAADAAFEAYTNYRVIRDYGAANAVAVPSGNPLRRMIDQSLPTENNLPVIRLGITNYYPGNGARVRFSTPIKYFTTRHVESDSGPAGLLARRGLADLSNRSFFTSSSLPGFRECRPVGAATCVPTKEPTYALPPNDLSNSGYVETSIPSGLRVNGRVVLISEYSLAIVDQIAPAYDQSVNTLSSYGGKAPLVTKGIWHDIVPDDLGAEYLQSTGYTITYNNLRYMADVMIPRAVGYSSGLIDYFFRGRLEITPVDQDVVAVVNAGEPHFANRSGEARLSSNGSQVFGFEKVRIRVRNTTETIVESGTGTSFPQATGGEGSRLVAIARYHLNTCYSPDLSGERVSDWNGARTEPVCASGQAVRSTYQQISVSTPLNVTSGELDSATPVEKLFDFSQEPIPVNATDLFIQVAYRGKLGEEADGIALGTYDVSEPTFVTFWNNTDYAWNGTSYVPPNPTYPLRSVYSFYVCGGFPSKLLYRYVGSPGMSAMLLPPPPGAVRLAMIFGRPDNATQRFPVRAVPIMMTTPHAPMRSSFTRGQHRQASKEYVGASVLAIPYENCFVTPPPSGADSWCFDPIQRRRGQRFGEIAQPIYWSLGGADGPDVDSIPLPAVTSPAFRDGGENRFNEMGSLQNCPAQPTSQPEEIRAIEEREASALLRSSDLY